MLKIVSTVLLIAVPTAASAQLADSAMSMLYDNTRSNMMQDSGPTQRSAPIGVDRGQPYATAPSLRFASSSSSTRAAQAAMLARLDKTNPTAAKTLAAEFRKSDTTAIFRALMQGSGLRPDDLGDIYTAYTALGYMIANNELGDPDPGALRALRLQIVPRLASGLGARLQTDRTSLGEEFKLLIVTLHAGWQGAQKEGHLSEYSSGVARLFLKQGGADLRNVRLTRNGFVPR